MVVSQTGNVLGNTTLLQASLSTELIPCGVEDNLSMMSITITFESVFREALYSR